MLTFLRPKKSPRFIFATALLTGAAVLTAIIGVIAGQAGNYDFAAFSSRIALALAVLVMIYVLPRLFQSVQWRSNYALHVPNAGLIFGAVILMVTVLALTSGNNLLYVVLAVLLATMIVSIVSARINLHKLKPSVRYPSHIFAGESVRFEITLKSEKRIFPSFSLSVDMVEEQQALTRESKTAQPKAFALSYFPLLPARSFAQSSIERRFDRRGVYPITGFLINTGFPFGFVEQRRFLEWANEIIVYPQPEPIEDFAHLLPMVTGQIESRAKGFGSDLHAIRPYLASDHHHHIDWKATAKTRQLMVREFTREDDWRITVLFDPHTDSQIAGQSGFSETFERAIVFAASLLSHFMSLGGEIRLVTPESDTGFGIGQSHLFVALRRLAELTPVGSEEMELMKEESKTRSFRILITSDPTAAASPTSATTQVVCFDELGQQKDS
ncbi:MAG: DUF58 domain-containing protein [Acidobacteria bacterium]|nr:DUF58 domain-containing protein [Acidobacteriota bacterium]